MASYVRPCWIKPDGEIVLCLNWNDHLHTAAAAFPESVQPEGAAVDAGWLKVFRVGDEPWFVAKSLTRQQREVVEGPCFGLIADEVADDARACFLSWRSMGRCTA